MLQLRSMMSNAGVKLTKILQTFVHDLLLTYFIVFF